MNLLCWMFGHSPPVYARKGWYSPGEQYGRVIEGATDGIGRWHGQVECECARCEKKFIMARIHIPKDTRTVRELE